MTINSKILVASATLLVLLTSCTKKTDDATTSSQYSAEKPSVVMGAIQTGIKAVGSDLSSVTTASTQNGISPQFSSSQCTSHGEPDGVSQSDASYPGLLTYCKLAINDGSPDTVQGGFQIVKAVACAVENAGISFDGVAKDVTINVDTTCFTQSQIDDMGVTSLTATVTGSSPASFNTNFSRGIVIELSAMNMTYKLGANVTSSKIEFVSMESESATKSGATLGSLDLTTGEVRFEARMDRLNCTTSGSCGWNRHLRIYADMSMVNGDPTDIESISFGYSNISNTPGQSSLSGLLVSASGNLTDGIKARLWQATNGSGGAPTATIQYQTVGNWVEVTNSKCYTSSSETATTCGSGIELFTTNTAFVFAGTYTSPTAFAEAANGQTFTAVDLNSDTQD